MKPIAKQNIVTAAARLQPLNEALTRKIPGNVKDTVVKTFLQVVTFKIFFFIIQSLSMPNKMDIIHIATYGKLENKPFFAISNLSTSAIYLGRFVITIK